MKIAWAFEPDQLKGKQLKQMDALIKSLADDGAATELVHIEHDIYPGMVAPYGVLLPYIAQRDARFEIEKSLKQAGVHVAPEHRHVVDMPVSSVSGSVDETLKAAARAKCDTVALFTHARTGVERILMGSFAETMVHRSNLDLLLLNPQSRWSGKIKKILFLDDFSEESRKHLRRVVALCSRLKATLVVFHYPHVTYDWTFEGQNPIVEKYRRNVDRRQRATVELCEKAGVKVEVVVKGGMSRISDAAFELRRKYGADLIVVAAKLGKLGALLGGSVTRQISRQSSVPVLVLKANGRHLRKTTANAKSTRARSRRISRLIQTPRSEARP